MNCPACNKVVPIIKKLKSKGDAVICVYCNNVIPSEDIAWKDGKFHFRVVGEVVTIDIPPRILMDDQVVAKLDLDQVRKKALAIMHREPNIRCVMSEFFIEDEQVRIELLAEKQE